ncbi:hypothetical protein FRB94_013030 [Tulasnella sp. JGI-2019a]|nr:hypothetical protein FRB94_013030 [Tulasnella sp. JGI-2019a]
MTKVYVIGTRRYLRPPRLRLETEDAYLISIPHPNRSVGGGGFCDLYRGIFLPTGLVFALKRPRFSSEVAGDYEAVMRRLDREGRIWSDLTHVNILPFYGIVVIFDETYLVSPWVEHGDLAKFVRAHLRYLALPDNQRRHDARHDAFDRFDEYRTVGQVYRIILFSRGQLKHNYDQVLGITAGLSYLHSHNIVHGDVKAANVLLNNNLVPALCDLGMAKIVDGVSETSSAMKGAGSVPWMSPELLRGASKTAESDIYALGITIGEMLTGIIPFSGLIHGALVVAIMNRLRPPFITPPVYRSDSSECLTSLAFLCRQEDPTLRPKATDITDATLPLITNLSSLDHILDHAELSTLRGELEEIQRQPQKPLLDEGLLPEETAEHHTGQPDSPQRSSPIAIQNDAQRMSPLVAEQLSTLLPPAVTSVSIATFSTVMTPHSSTKVPIDNLATPTNCAQPVKGGHKSNPGERGSRGNLSNLEERIRHHRETLSLRPVGHPARSFSLKQLGNALQARFDRRDDMADLEESIQHYKDATAHTLSPLSDRLSSTHSWIIAARENDLDSLEDAYTVYMDLFDRSLLLVTSSIFTTDTYTAQLNKDERDVTEDATAHAIKKGQLHKAVQIAERGRALLFTQLGNCWTPLDDLKVLNKGLADRFRSLSLELEDSSTLSFRDAMIAGVGDQVTRRQKIADDLDQTVEEIRRLEGFKNFLRVTPFASLQRAAEGGPIILVNISRYHSDAIIILEADDPLSVPLPDATHSFVEVLVKSLITGAMSRPEYPKTDRGFVDILRTLWDIIVAPIVLKLETTVALPMGSRIWWMPTLGAWWLPLHAAGPYQPGERNLSDRFVPSYALSLSSLIRSRSSYQPIKDMSGPRMLVVAQAEAEGQVPTPNVEVEVTLVRQLPARVTVIEGEGCTRNEVLAGLRDAAWVHFSCHGHQHPAEPFKSHFSLRMLDTPLTLLDIIQSGLPHAELAVLSACHSAATTPDDVLNLAQGILFAGFRGVVGTMWAMDDRDGPVVAKEFYNYMFRNGPEAVDCRDAAKALVMGVRELRRRRVPLERWINFIHYGI